MRESVAIAVICVVSAIAVAEVKPQEVVAKVHSAHSFLSSKSATAWCLTPACDIMVTNSHVVEGIHGAMEVDGVRVASAITATGPNDEGSKLLPGFVEDFKLTWVRDVALLHMKKPLASKGMHGVSIFAGELHRGDNFTLMAYPAGRLTISHGSFAGMAPDGSLQFDVDTQVSGGASGGLVLNNKDEVVGVLFAAAGAERRSFYAVPIWSFADFVKKNDPRLYADVFPTEPFRPSLPLARKTIAQQTDAPTQSFQAAVGGLEPSEVLPVAYLSAALTASWPERPPRAVALQVRPVEPAEVQSLRREAQRLADQMKNFIALQTLTLPRGIVWQHQVRVIDGHQTFRTADGKDLSQLPLPAYGGPVPGGEWQTLPEMVGSDLRLPVKYVGEKTIAGTTIRVFTYDATAEDQVCQLRIGRGAFHKMWFGAVPCHGEVWTDEGYHIVRITQEMLVPPHSGAKRFQSVVLYGWLRPAAGIERLVPTSMHLAVQMSHGEIYETSGRFSDYRMFHATSSIVQGGQ